MIIKLNYPVIVFEDVWFSYSDLEPILRGVNLRINEGEVIAILGENGAGKTTLIKHLNGLLKPTHGNVYIYGENTKNTSVAKLSKKVGIVFQNPDHQLFAETVEDEVSFALRNFNYPEHIISLRVEKILKMLDLWEYRKVSPFSLSGGERKRVAIASILSYDPSIIVMDEPTIGQDYAQKQKLSEIIRLLHIQGKTIIVVTHDIEFVCENFPKTIILSQGKVLAYDLTRNILTNFELLLKARLLPPQIPYLASRFDSIVSKNVLYVWEMRDELLRAIRR
ncbi:MAG: ABC transporter ATP-binding protein [Candidatus Methanomethylicia archaeon]